MFRRWMAAVVLGSLVTPLAQADTFDLKREKIKVKPANADVLPQVELRSQDLPSTIVEPRYRSENPQRFLAQFAQALGIPFAVDERRGPGKGYDWLIVDDEATGDLTEGKKIVGKPYSRSYSYLETTFSPFALQLPAADEAQEYPVQARFSTRRDEMSRANSTVASSSICS